MRQILERETDFDSQPKHQEPDTDSEGPERTPELMKVQEGEPGGNVQRQCPESVASAFLCIICEVSLRCPCILMPLEEWCQKYQDSRSVCCTMHSLFQGTLEMLHLFPSVKCSPMITQYHQSHFGSCSLHINVHQVETDYSWALRQSVMLAFNKEHLSSYLDRAYELCTGEKSWDDMKSYTVLHICSAHILKAVRQAVSRQTEDKGLRDFATYAFARLQDANNMTESRVVFCAFCALLTTPRNTNLVKESLCVLESVILRSKEDTLEETSQSEDWEMCESEERRHAMTIIGRSAFSAFFQQIMKEVKEEEAGDETCLAKEDNPYFCPGILTVLFDPYLAIYPLWSGLLLGDLTRYESCEQDLVTTLTRYQLSHRKMPEPPLNLDQCRETWMKKKEERFPDTKSKFFSVPQNMPVPQKKKRMIHKDVAKSQTRSSPEPVHSPAEALPVEEEIDMLWTKPASALVVAVVKSDDQSLEFLLHHEEFLKLRPHGWISGETIECYIRALLNAKGPNLYQLSHYTTGVILNGRKDQVIRQGLKKVNFEHYDGVISVVNIADMCWRFVYLHAITNTIFIVDPQRGNNEVELATQACTKFGEYFRMRGNQYGRKDWVDTMWKPGTIHHSFREDGFSCGVFMAKHMVGHFPKIPVCGQTDTKTNGKKEQTEELCTWVFTLTFLPVC
ncbi:unnamed protein product [Leuciscus chuanchicus]